MNKLHLILIVFSVFFASCKEHVSKVKNETKQEETPINSSLNDINQKLDKDPNNAEYLMVRAKLNMQSNHLNEAIVDIQSAIKLQPDNTDYYLKLADYYLTAGQLKNAMGVLKKVLSMKPKNTEALLKMGEINLMVRKYKDVFTYANAALEIDPYNATAFFMRAFTYKELKDTTRAIENFMQCIKNDPKNYNANIELGLIYSANKDPLSIDFFKNAIAIDSINEIAYYNLGMFYQNNDYLNEALDIYRKLIKVKPDFPYSYYNTGYIYMQLLKAESEAIPYFTKAIAVKPDYFEAFFNRGLCYEILGDVQRARQDYLTALKLHHNYKKAIEGLNRLDK